MIFQDPMASLNERAKVDYIVSEGLINYHLYKDEQDRKMKVNRALEEVGLLPEFASRFPHEFSGGQRQRIGIARTLIMEPEFVVADEPISALDVSIRAQVLNLLNRLKHTRGLTYMFIARRPLHPYTQALLSAVPIPDPRYERKRKLQIYDPSVHDYSEDLPIWEEVGDGHYVYGNQKELEQYRKRFHETDFERAL